MRIGEALDAMRDLPEFLEVGLDSIHTVGNMGNTPLHIAARWNDPELVALLASAGAEINASGEEGTTPLHAAAENGALEAAVRLLDLGADPSALDDHGMTPLCTARVLKCRALVDLLERAAGR
ncbi:MAG: ankyrin repeat domain-containing protein [Zoogloeaceae bacterium]|nr:ankyrin repeat domain-containing protein [Zoogloeaceae bacterium]